MTTDPRGPKPEEDEATLVGGVGEDELDDLDSDLDADDARTSSGAHDAPSEEAPLEQDVAFPHVEVALPVVAIVGRPNVGKSTLFNRLARRRQAVIHDTPGVTRDRHYAKSEMNGNPVMIVDTGGFDPKSDNPFAPLIERQVRIALEEADVVVCVLDATMPPVAADFAAVQLLRESKRPAVFVANKADSPAHATAVADHYGLGVREVIPVSALHGVGMVLLEDAVAKVLPELGARVPIDPSIPRIAIVGRPNAGKSSLVNRLLGEERQLVSDVAGTTVDSVDSLFEKDGRRFVLVDTAGLRRKRSVDEGVESLAVFAALRAIERANAVVLLIDGEVGITEQDTRIAGLVVDRGRALVVALNKSDLLSDEDRRKRMTDIREALIFASWAPLLFVSAKTGRGTTKLIDLASTALEQRGRRISTSEINKFFESVLSKHPPPIHKGRSVRIYYVTQITAYPPTFAAVTNHPDAIHFSYQRYVINQLREHFGFAGTPVRVRYRPKRSRSTVVE